MLAGSLAKAVRAAAASRKIALTSQQLATLSTIERRVAMAEGAFDLAVGGYRAAQSYHNLTNEDGSTAEGAGQAAEALLRVFSGTLAAHRLAKSGGSVGSSVHHDNLPKQSATKRDVKAGALMRRVIDGKNQSYLVYHPGPLTSANPRLQRLNSVLGDLERSIRAEYDSLVEKAASNPVIHELRQRIHDYGCTEISEMVDEYLRTGKIPSSISDLRLTRRTAEELATSRGSDAQLLSMRKADAQREIVRQLTERGNGATAIVMFGREGSAGHCVNAVNIDGAVYFIDGLDTCAIPATGNVNRDAFLSAFDVSTEDPIVDFGGIWLINTTSK